MSSMRIVLIITVVAIAVFCAQNWQESITLVFLGMQTVPLPLGLLILISMIAGGCTSLLFSGLFQLSNYLSARGRSRLEEPLPSTPRSTIFSGNRGGKTPSSTPRDRSSNDPPPFSPPNRVQVDLPNHPQDDDDDFEEELESEHPHRQSAEFHQEPTNYEVTQAPQASSWSGSVYSFSYKQPTDSAVGKTESVYDADYKVIKPPVKPIAESEDDWEQKPKKTDHDDDDWI